jgi:hypothetical protein
MCPYTEHIHLQNSPLIWKLSVGGYSTSEQNKTTTTTNKQNKTVPMFHIKSHL